MDHEGSSFICGCAATADFFFFAKELDRLAEQDTPNSSFFRFKAADPEAQFRKYDENVGWPAISMATTKTADRGRVVVAVGPQGDFWELAPSTTQEKVESIPSLSGQLRQVRSVGDRLFACGMGRTVLERSVLGQWTSMGPGTRDHDPLVVGFEDMAGYSSSEVYCVGWSGEIWWLDHDKWRQVDSPTSAILSALCCTAEGVVYAVGHDGVMVKGRHDQWELVDTGRSENLRDVASYSGRVWAVSDFEIFTLGPSGLVAEVNFADPDDIPATCLHLLEAPDGLVSMGSKEVFVLDSGLWRRLV